MTAEERWDRLKWEVDSQLSQYQLDMRMNAWGESSTAHMLAAQNRIQLLIQIQAFMRGLESK